MLGFVVLAAVGFTLRSVPLVSDVRLLRTAVPQLNEIAFVSSSGVAFETSAEAIQCLLLPKPPYPGEPAVTVGEVMLQELEDDQETRTQLFFLADGTVAHGATDGPPPEGFCGLWQCGDSKFQMTLKRSFRSVAAVLDRGQTGQMTDDIVYTVTRVYDGNVDPACSGGVGLVEGRIDMVVENEAATWASSDARSIRDLDPFNIETPPIGYFILDVNTISELEPEVE